VRTSSVPAVIKRLTGANLDATRNFLFREGFAPGKGFWSQYAGQGTVSCATSAVCIYALSETGELTQRQKSEFERVCCSVTVCAGTVTRSAHIAHIPLPHFVP
jgi:hypothetical protein